MTTFFSSFRSLWLPLSLLLAHGLSGCGSQAQQQDTASDNALPIMGRHEVDAAGDTAYYRIPDFQFVDQDSNLVSAETVEDKIYVTDFFFTTCPSICPKMSQQMVRLHDEFKDDPEVVLISHTIDPAYDSVAVLREYAQALGVDSDKWHLVTGEKDSIYYMARQYMVSAVEDENAPGGFMHSGAFVLLDPNRHIRGYYDGTQPEEVDQLMTDMRKLMAQQ